MNNKNRLNKKYEDMIPEEKLNILKIKINI